jgi:hypothetical protein
MSNGYKRCPNGHFYKEDLAACPFCNSKGNPVGAGATQAQTQAYVGSNDAGGNNKTQAMPGNNGETIPNSGAFTAVDPTPKPAPTPNKTMIIGDEGTEGQGPVRSSRKLVGWLVSYTLSDMGADFKLFEGRNIIGRDLDCQISVNDPSVSAKHAVLLFRAGHYSITDQQSTSGTFVNGEDIELAPRYLNDGDTIRVGKTAFKFRTSL